MRQIKTQPPFLQSRAAPFAAAFLIAVAAAITYSNSFHGAFTLDDRSSIHFNATIHEWRNFAAVFSPPKTGITASGRPVLNASLALNYALGGVEPRGYHAVNLLVHILASLTLFGLLRRTLQRPGLAEKFGGSALPPAFAVALLWTLHPLQTQAVDYIVQRAESMVSLMYLLTLYGLLRAIESATPRRWLFISFLACLLGVYTKEVIVSAPLIALLYDRTFGAGNFRDALRRRAIYYASLFATWLPLAWQMKMSGAHAGSAGFGFGANWLHYALIQCWAIPHYLWLAIWPHPLIYDYGRQIVKTPWDVLGQAALIFAMIGATLWALRRRPALGFLGAAFFCILAPSSSFVPVADPVWEYRVYLALASPIIFAALALHQYLGRAAWIVCIVWALGLGFVSHARNDVYRTETSIWQNTVDRMPGNARAQGNLGFALNNEGRYSDGALHMRRAIDIYPYEPLAYANLGHALTSLSRPAEAIPVLQQGLDLDPQRVELQCNMGEALSELGQLEEAVPYLLRALDIDPNYAQAKVNLGAVYFKQGKIAEAVDRFKAALADKPGDGDSALNLCLALVKLGKPEETPPYFEIALRADPRNASVEYNYGLVLAALGRLPDARAHFEAALKIEPGNTKFSAAMDSVDRNIGRQNEK